MPFDDLRAFLQRLEEDDQLQPIDTELRCGRGDNELQALMPPNTLARSVLRRSADSGGSSTDSPQV